MAILPIPGYGDGLPRTPATHEVPRSGGGADFGRLLQRGLNAVNAEQAGASQAVRDLALGHTDSLHQVMWSVARADLAFRLVLEIRNRLIEAYQEVTKMPV
jgi:flagellar hook-basal body complex protein FliE